MTAVHNKNNRKYILLLYLATNYWELQNRRMFEAKFQMYTTYKFSGTRCLRCPPDLN